MLSISRLALLVLVLALVAAAASLFGPYERWWGMDIGATGAAVFALTLGTGACLLVRHPDEIFPPDWSIAERRAWAGLVFLVLVYVNFVRFMITNSHLESPPASIGEIPSTHFMANLFVLLIAWAVVAKTIGGPEKNQVELDERDLRMYRAAARAGDWAFTAVVIGIVLLLALAPAASLSWWLSPLIAANVLVGLLIGRSLVEHTSLVACYAIARR
jgi:hypothetical protein